MEAIETTETKEKEIDLISESDINFLTEVFSLARIQLVNDEKGLMNIIGFKKHLFDKLEQFKAKEKNG